MGFARVTLTEPVLGRMEEVIGVKKVNDLGVDDVFHDFTGYACKRDWAII